MAFADTLDLASNLSAADKELVALERATDMIRAATEQTITQATSTITLMGAGRRLLQLPQKPVQSVASVIVSGLTWTPDVHYRVDDDGLLVCLGGVWRRGVTYTVTYTHGYQQVPEDLVRLCAAVADRLMDKTGDDVRAIQESLGSRSVSISYGPAADIFGSEGQRILDRYRLTPLP